MAAIAAIMTDGMFVMHVPDGYTTEGTISMVSHLPIQTTLEGYPDLSTLYHKHY